MNPEEHQVRRATVDDLQQLRAIWQTSRLNVETLEKRLTEFQVADDGTGKLAAAVGLKIVGQNGLLHSEVIPDPGIADQLRELFLKRIRTLATNHALVRIWTLETAPFWQRNGFTLASDEATARLPEEWRKDQTAGWLMLQLRAISEDGQSPEEQAMKLFVAAQREETAELMRRAKVVKVVATCIAFLIVVLIGFAILYVLRNNPRMLTPGQ
jgi:N-acetylglutamate synthase-like GNAT family acetyltransferase